MAVLGRETLKRYFANGQNLTAQKFIDMMDSGGNLAASGAQVFNANLSMPTLVTDRVSAENLTAQILRSSGASFTGRIVQGVSSNTSASDTRGFPLVYQSSTAEATATTQIAFLPQSSRIFGLGLTVLRASSGAAGGTTVRLGTSDAHDYFGTITVSGVGQYRFSDVSASRLQNVSGAVFMCGLTATAGATFIGSVEYVPSVGVSAALATQTMIPPGEGTPIGDMVNAGGLAAAFDGNTSQFRTQGAYRANNIAVGYVGKNWGSPRTVTGFQVYGCSDNGFEFNNQTQQITLTLEGSTDDFVSSTVSLGSAPAQTNAAGLVISKLSGLVTTTGYQYHRIKINKVNTSDGPICAEVQFFEG